MHYELVKKKNIEYIKIVEHEIDFTPKRAYFYFENLFNGNKVLGTLLNKDGEINDVFTNVLVFGRRSDFAIYERELGDCELGFWALRFGSHGRDYHQHSECHFGESPLR